MEVKFQVKKGKCLYLIIIGIKTIHGLSPLRLPISKILSKKGQMVALVISDYSYFQ